MKQRLVFLLVALVMFGLGLSGVCSARAEVGSIVQESSGLVAYDDFSEDVSDLYSGYDFTVADGHLYGNVASTYAVRSGTAGTNCITARILTANEVYVAGLFLSAHPDYEAVGDLDGYTFLAGPLKTSANYIYEIEDNVYDWRKRFPPRLAVASYNFMRLYYDGSNVYGGAGETSISTILSHASSTYSTLYGGINYRRYYKFDWIEYRTSYAPSCSGLPSGWYFLVSDGTTTATAMESSHTATVAAGYVLTPYTKVEVYDGDPTTTGHLMATLLAEDATWRMGGGDVFKYKRDARHVKIAPPRPRVSDMPLGPHNMLLTHEPPVKQELK